VEVLNASLRASPLCTLCCFVALDMGSALALLAAAFAAHVSVPADFALAYAICKGLLRAPRLALDALGAAALARLHPSLALVHVSLLLDAAVDAPAAAWRAVSLSMHLRPPAAASTASVPRRRSGAYRELKRLSDSYGLAYMAAKNVIGPLSILTTYALLRQGVDLQALLGGIGAQAGEAGRLAGLLALASTASTLLFPAVVLGAAWLAPRLAASLRLSGAGDVTQSETTSEPGGDSPLS
jgi:hypothetical protein